jgi:hypothetical protein
MTIIAEYEPIKYSVTYISEGEIIETKEVPYGELAPALIGYSFDERRVYQDISIEMTKLCTTTYSIDGESFVLLCEETPDIPAKDGFVFTEWKETDFGYEAIFVLEEYDVTFRVGDYMESVKVKPGMIPVLSENLLSMKVEWDQEIAPIFSDTVYTGYVEPDVIPEVKVEYIDGVYLLDFNIDISDMDVLYLVVDGELRSAHDYFIEKDETSLFDRKIDWFKIHVPEEETLERVFLSNGIEYRYTIESHLVESDFFKRILRFVQSIFA